MFFDLERCLFANISVFIESWNFLYKNSKKHKTNGYTGALHYSDLPDLFRVARSCQRCKYCSLFSQLLLEDDLNNDCFIFMLLKLMMLSLLESHSNTITVSIDWSIILRNHHFQNCASPRHNPRSSPCSIVWHEKEAEERHFYHFCWAGDFPLTLYFLLYLYLTRPCTVQYYFNRFFYEYKYCSVRTGCSLWQRQ